MTVNRRQWMTLLAFLSLAPLLHAPAFAQAAARAPAPDDKTIADAYVYLLGRALVIRQEHMDRKGPRNRSENSRW